MSGHAIGSSGELILCAVVINDTAELTAADIGDMLANAKVFRCSTPAHWQKRTFSPKVTMHKYTVWAPIYTDKPGLLSDWPAP